MTRNLMRALLASVALVSAGPVWAETLADAFVKAYQTSPLLESGRASLRALDENVPQARSNLRPQVSANAAATGSSNVKEFPLLPTYAAELQASLLLFDSGQTKAAIESARYGVASGRASLLNIEQEVLFAAVTAYMDVIQAQEFVRIAQNDLKVLGEQLEATNNRFEVGEVTRTDVSQTEARRAQSEANLVDAQGNVQIARAAYLAAVGTLPGRLDAAPPHPALPKTVREAEAIGVRQNPSIVAARFAERGAVADFDRARAATGVTIQATGAMDYSGRHSLGFNASPTNSVGDRVNLSVGVGAQVPLYTGGRNSSLIRQAQQVLEQRKFDLQDAGRQVIEQVNNAWTQLNVARASIVANKEQVRAAQVAFEGVTEEARLGARSTLDVLDSDQERLQAEAEVVRAQRNEYVAAYGVLRAMGLLTVEHLGLGIESYNPDTYFSQVQRAPTGGYDTRVVDRIRARWER